MRDPYAKYVNDDTRFWNASGLSVQLAGNGIEVQLESRKALLLGGIAFETPDLDQGKIKVASAEDHVFPLFADYDLAQAASYTRKILVVSDFPGSVAGLAPGSPVTIHGLLVGRVVHVGLAYDRAKDTVVAPVRYQIEPERITGVGQRVYQTDQEAVAAVMKAGLRARLQSSNLLTGAQEIALDFVKDAPPVEVAMQDGAFVLPTTDSGSFAGLTASASELLNKVNTMPFDQIGKSLEQLLNSTNNLVNGPQLREALTKLSATLATAETFTHNLNTGTAPAFRQLPEMASQLQRTLNNTNKLLVSLDAGYGDQTKFNRDLDRLMVQANDAVSSMRALADLLSRHPEALIKGRPAGGIE